MGLGASRREFVRVAGFVAAAAAVRCHASPAAPPIRLGIASYTFRSFTRSQMIGFMRQLQVSDLNAKSVKDHLPDPADAEASAVQDYASSAIRLHAAGVISLAHADEIELRARFEYCKRAGVRVMVGGDPTEESLPLVERLAVQYDIKVAIHNHGPEDKLWPSPLEILKAVRSLDSRMGCCIDVGHAARAGADVVEAIHAAGPRLFNVHIKDLAKTTEIDSQVPVGQGVLPIAGIFRALLAERYAGFVDLEYEIHADDPMPGVTSSFEFMRKTVASLSS